MSFCRRKSIILAFAMFLSSVAMTVQAEPSNKWRITFNHSADSAGVIVFRIAPIGGEPIEVETKIPDRTRENKVADLVRDTLKPALGKAYKVEVDDFESVLIKKKGKTPNFDLTLVNSSVAGVTIKLKRE